MTARLLFLSLAILYFHAGRGQETLTGKIFSPNDSVIKGASVLNTRTRTVTQSNKEGQYTIPVAEGDRIIFSMAGYLPDTVTVLYSMLLTHHDITLKIHFISLKGVTVTGSYEADSLARRNFYKHIYDQRGITGGNRPTDGVGISISPLSHFSQKAKQQRQLKKRLIQQERDAYIDRTFPAEWVARLTRLEGDSLNLFLYRYRPSYTFCRRTNREEMLVYINDKLKEFRKPKAQP